LARQAVSWGANVTGSLAVGIAGAVDLVTQALNFMGRVIGGLLKPGSPPKLLPELDTWGRGAAEAWLAGWTDADFGALGQFAGEVQGALKALSGAGGMAEADVIPRLLGSREAFAQLLQEIRATGSASAEAFAAIRRAAGPVGEQAEELARRYARVVEATGRLAEVQRQLAGIEGQQQDRLDAGRLAELEAILADPRASAGQKERARLEQERIKLLMEERDLQAEADEAQGSLDAYRSRLDVETETRNLLGEQATLAQQLLKQLQDVLSPLEQQLKGYQLQQQELQDIKRLAEIDYSLQHDKLTEAQKVALELERQELTVGRMIRAQEAGKLGIDLSGLKDVEIVLADFRKGAGEALGDEEGGLVGLIKGASSEFDKLKGYDLAGLLAPAQTVIDEMTLGFQEGEEAALNLQGTLAGMTMPAWWNDAFGGGTGQHKPKGGLTAELNDLNENLGAINVHIETGRGLWQTLSEKVGGFFAALGPTLPHLSGLAWITLPRLETMLGLAKAGFSGVATALLGPVGAVAALFGVKTEMGGVLGQFGELVKEGFVKGVVDTWKLLTDPVSYFLEKLLGVIDAYKRFRDLTSGGTGDVPTAPEGTRSRDNQSGNALGTGYFRGGLTWVGERGPELVGLPRGSRVWPAQQSAAMAAAGGGLTVTMGPVYVRDEEDMDALVWRIVREIKRRER